MGTSHALGYAVYDLTKLYAALSRWQAQLKTGNGRRGEFGATLCTVESTSTTNQDFR